MNKKICSYLKLFLLVICIMIILLVMEKSIPNNRSRTNIINSKEYYQEYFKQYDNLSFIQTKYSMLNVHGDLSTISIIYLENNKDLIKEFIENNYDFNGTDKIKSGQGLNSFSITGDYSRYWHGSLIILKPLLSFFTMKYIYYIYLVCLSILFFLLLVKLFKHSKLLGVLFTISSIVVNMFYTSFSDSLYYVFLISIIGSLILINMYEKKNKNIDKLFLVIGMLTAYFDFLSCETVTLTIPLFIYVYLFIKDNRKVNYKLLINYALLWLFGYIFTFIVKWLFVFIYYHGSVSSKVFSPMKERVYYERSNIFVMFYNNIVSAYKFIYPLDNNIVKIGILILGVISFVMLLIKSKNRINYICLFMISLIPFGRYFILSSHSDYHNYFTYRAFIITILFLLVCVCLNIKSFINKN